MMKIATVLTLLTYALYGQTKELIEIIANSHLQPDIRQVAFQNLCAACPEAEIHYISYCPQDEISITAEIPASLYSEIIKSMPIPCVDAFVYNFEKNSYLLIQRVTEPGKGLWWLPGGRIFKGESFYRSAVRKTKKEAGIDICPIAQLGTYSTYFSNSAWGADLSTDTKNTAVLALCGNQDVQCDEHHEGMRWAPLDEEPSDPYLLMVYREAKEKLAEMGFKVICN